MFLDLGLNEILIISVNLSVLKKTYLSYFDKVQIDKINNIKINQDCKIDPSSTDCSCLLLNDFLIFLFVKYLVMKVEAEANIPSRTQTSKVETTVGILLDSVSQSS